MRDVRIRLFFKPLFLEAFSFVKKWHIVYEKTIKKGRDDMILNITDENWAEVIEDTLTVETFTALKKYIHALESSQRDFPDSVTKLVVNEAKCNMTPLKIEQLLDKKPLRRLETISISNPDKYFCTVDGLLYSGNKEHLLFCPRGRKDVLVIPDGTRSISDIACSACSFSVLVLPDSVESIGVFACYHNTNLERVEGGKGIRKIYNGAFLECQKLEHFEFGNAVEEVGDSAFMNTTLTEINLPDSIFCVERNAFNTTAIYNGKKADVGPDGMYNINIPASIEYVEPGAFSNAANVHTSFVNRKLIDACLRIRSGNLQRCYPCNMWRLKIDGKPDIIMPKDIDRSKLDAISDEINKFMLSEDTMPPEIYRYSQSATGLTAALEQCRKYPNTNLKRFITRNISIIFQDIIYNPLVKNGEELIVGLINDKVFTDAALKRLLKEVEKAEDTQNLTVLKTYILNSISNYPQNTFRI